MKKIFFSILLAGITIASFAQTKTTAKKPVAKKSVGSTSTSSVSPLKTPTDSTSYAFGTSIGQSLKSTGLSSFNYDVLIKGIKDAVAGKTILTQAQAQECISAAMDKSSKAKFAANIAEGKAFLDKNKLRAGVKTTPSGLQYEVITQGTGVKPTPTDSVLVHYRGTLLNGKQFDSSYDRNEPITLTLDRVIRGWTEGLQLMSAGSKYKLFIPYTLAYGERGAGQDIPPYSTLVFDIELLKVNGK